MTRGLLFLCVANSARSQMAEGIARALAGDAVRVQSAGSEPTRIHPLAVRVLAEIGIDISAQRAKSLDEVDRSAVETVITLCAEESCPFYAGAVRRLHWDLPDPAGHDEPEASELARFRAVRDELVDRVARLLRDERPDASPLSSRRIAPHPIRRGIRMTQPLSKALVAEFVGTFALVFVGAGAGALGAGGLVGVALAHGLTVMAFAYAYGHLSGTHVNPAVTFGLWVAGKIDARRLISYWFFQCLGGIAAGYALLGLLGGPVGNLGTGTLARGLVVGGASVTVTPAWGFALEAILAFFLVNTVLNAAVTGKAGELAGVAIGFTLTVNILMGGLLTGAIFNPARQLGPALASGQTDNLALYLVAPLVGAAAAAALFRSTLEK